MLQQEYCFLNLICCQKGCENNEKRSLAVPSSHQIHKAPNDNSTREDSFLGQETGKPFLARMIKKEPFLLRFLQERGQRRDNNFCPKKFFLPFLNLKSIVVLKFEERGTPLPLHKQELQNNWLSAVMHPLHCHKKENPYGTTYACSLMIFHTKRCRKIILFSATSFFSQNLRFQLVGEQVTIHCSQE